MRTRSLRSVILPSLLALVLGVAGCKHQAAAVQPPAAPAPTPTAPPPASPTVTLQAAPTVVQQGQSATLTWSSTNATALNLTPGVGNVAPQGSAMVTPDSSQTYTITATGPGGSADANVRVTVNSAAAPAANRGASIEELFTREVQDVYFDLDKADIRSDARNALTATAQFLRSYPQIKVTLEGHCDERGSTEYNLALGDRRAQAAKDFLVAAGIAADRIQTVSYGKERPFCMDHNEACWQQNRRGHFVMAR
jgi:peptidoglycan-associated lipoprotein